MAELTVVLCLDVLVDVPIRFLVDLRAEVSIIPDTHEAVSWFRGMEQHAVPSVLADGANLNVFGLVSLEFNMKGESVTPEFYVVKGHIAPILGSDFIRLFGFVKLDFSDQVVPFGPKVHSPKLEHDFKVPRISGQVISHNLVVPSRQEIVDQCPVENDTPG